LVKLVKAEAESPALRAFIRGAGLISSELVVTEVPRAVRRKPEPDPTYDPALGLVKAEILLEDVTLHPIDRPTPPTTRACRSGHPVRENLSACPPSPPSTAAGTRQ
jgi:hypothetical protein